MIHDKSIGVVVPAYNEERHIGEVVGTMPDFVDRIIVVNDCSTDRTAVIIAELARDNGRVVAVNHERNQGNGAALISGYIKALELNLEVIAVMDGDGQMDPVDLFNVILPVTWGEVDYTKGNRFNHPDVARLMPRHRLIGNSVLTLLTKFATGYWHLVDPQCSFTAISRNALRAIAIDRMVAGFGYNADILSMLNIRGFKAQDVDVRPIYGDQQSKIRLRSYIPKTSLILIRLFFQRLWKRYVVLDFHPLVLFYAFAFFNTLFIILPFLGRFVWVYRSTGIFPSTTFTILIFTILITFQSILFALWMDMDYNNRKSR